MHKLLRSIATALACISALALLLAMGIIGADVVLRAVANSPILGSIDMVEMLFSIILFCALPASCLKRQHIVVDLVDVIVSKDAVRRLVVCSSVLTVVVLALLTWQASYAVSDLYIMQTSTLNIELPKWTFGVIACAGLLLSAVIEACNLAAPKNAAAGHDPAMHES